MLMRQILGWIVGAVLFGGLLINALFMLISPRAWFRLPAWFPTRSSSMTEERYGTGPGSIETRIGGAVMLVGILYVLYDMFFRR
jgi:hypothetical protein